MGPVPGFRFLFSQENSGRFLKIGQIGRDKKWLKPAILSGDDHFLLGVDMVYSDQAQSKGAPPMVLICFDIGHRSVKSTETPKLATSMEYMMMHHGICFFFKIKV